ncbi:SH3 domain-containing protein [Streptomyces longwoodensis]|uniref:SH3 domain-containing protein n=1 Tax=Streptomyces longwoodensis TaxID=68231 RepID=UPI0036FBCF90
MAGVALAFVAAASTTLVAAPSASAVDSSACDRPWYGLNGHITGNGVNLRNGPGTKYASKGQLSRGTTFYFYCFKTYGYETWDYLKVTSGANKGVKGWVNSRYSWW